MNKYVNNDVLFYFINKLFNKLLLNLFYAVNSCFLCKFAIRKIFVVVNRI